MNVNFSYKDFDGAVKTSTAEVQTETKEGVEWFWAQNLSAFGCGKKVSSYFVWHPVRGALQDLVGGRTVLNWTEIKS